MSDGNQTTESDGEAAHAALADFWHPNNPAANAEMSIRVTRAIRAARLQERERCAKIARRRSSHSGLRPIEDIAWQIAEEIERVER